MASEPERGRCPICHAGFRLRRDGTLRWHLGDICIGGKPQRCTGVGHPPAGKREVSDG